MADLIVGYDGTGPARAALETAITIARGLGDRVVLAYAEAPPDDLRGEEWKVHRQALREIGEQALAEALDHVRAAGVEVDTALVPLRPVEALVELTRSRGARMIVVGTHGEGPITGALLGSVAHRLLHRSPVPVLVVPVT